MLNQPDDKLNKKKKRKAPRFLIGKTMVQILKQRSETEEHTFKDTCDLILN